MHESCSRVYNTDVIQRTTIQRSFAAERRWIGGREAVIQSLRKWWRSRGGARALNRRYRTKRQRQSQRSSLLYSHFSLSVYHSSIQYWYCMLEIGNLLINVESSLIGLGHFCLILIGQKRHKWSTNLLTCENNTFCKTFGQQEKLETLIFTDFRIFIDLLNQHLTVTVRDDYTPHDTRWQCTAKIFIMVCLGAYMLNLTGIMYF